MATVSTQEPRGFVPITIVLDDVDEAGALCRLLGETSGRVLYSLYSELQDNLTEQGVDVDDDNYDLWSAAFDCRED